MIDAEAKIILSEIRQIPRYKTTIDYIKDNLARIDADIRTAQEPKSPSGGDGVKLENHNIEKSSIVNSLLTDEMLELERLKKFQSKLTEAEVHLKSLRNRYDGDDERFIDCFVKGWTYTKLSNEFGYEHPYKHMIVLIKEL